MDHDVSKRAEILWRVVKHLWDDYEDFGDRIAFGRESEFIKEGMDLPTRHTWKRSGALPIFRRENSQATHLGYTDSDKGTEHLLRRWTRSPGRMGARQKFAASYLQMWKEVLGKAVR